MRSGAAHRSVPPRSAFVREDYGFFFEAESIFFAAVSILAAAESIFMEAESIFMPVSAGAAAGAGAIAGAAVSALGVSFVLQAATTSTAATRARRFMVTEREPVRRLGQKVFAEQRRGLGRCPAQQGKQGESCEPHALHYDSTLPHI